MTPSMQKLTGRSTTTPGTRTWYKRLLFFLNYKADKYMLLLGLPFWPQDFQPRLPLDLINHGYIAHLATKEPLPRV